MSEVLDARTRTISDDLVVKRHAGEGYRLCFRGEVPVCDDGPSTWERAAHFAADMAEVGPRKAVAILGGGFCVLPRVLRCARHTMTVYEIEAALGRFCPNYATFVPGDWRTTLTGLYDVIVYDIGDNPDRAYLESHLNPGGLLLGLEG